MNLFFVSYLKKVYSFSNILLENVIRFYSKTCCYLSGGGKESRDMLSNLKNKYSGERCFIICTGPSLKVADLDKIHENGDVSFACNKIDGVFPYTDWRPTYYAVFDDNVLNTLHREGRLNKIMADARFFSDYNYCKTKDGVNNIFLKKDGNRNYLESPLFSDDLQKKIITIGTVTFALIEIAAYLGFKYIYIIGCDNSYSIIRQKDGTIIQTGNKSYFDGSNDIQKLAVDVWEMDIAYGCARHYADTHGIKIFNATRGGHLEVFERKDFDTLF